jgi:hypothetical protein
MVVCNVDSLSLEALAWLEEESQDLCWITKRSRRWLEPKRDDEMTRADLLQERFYASRGVTINRPVVERSTDHIRFASLADATYFKLKYL